MKRERIRFVDSIFTFLILVAAFGVSLLLKGIFQTPTMIPLVFVLGVFLISWKTKGYFWGIAAPLISVLAVNYAFTYPYWAFDLICPKLHRTPWQTSLPFSWASPLPPR